MSQVPEGKEINLMAQVSYGSESQQEVKGAIAGTTVEVMHVHDLTAQILKCTACILSREGTTEFYGAEIITCRQANPGTTHNSLRQLENKRLFTSDPNVRDDYGRKLRAYEPTELGWSIIRQLRPNKPCRLPESTK